MSDHKDKKILLFIPNSRWFGKRPWLMVQQASLILTALLKDSYDFSIVDANGQDLSQHQAGEQIKAAGPDMVMISALSVEYHRHYHEAVRIARDACSDTVIVMGGVYPTVLLDEAMKDKDVDYFFIGHAEERINDFLEFVFEGDHVSLGDFAGVAFRSGGMLINNPVCSYIGDVDQLARPDYSLFDIEPYFIQDSLDYQFNSTKRSAYVITSYGCPYNCCFCATRTISGRKVAFRAVEDVLEEIDFLVETYGIGELNFLDDCLLYDRARIENILKGLIERDYDLTWKAATVSAWHLNYDLLKLMKESGCEQITISVESGSARVLKEVIHKPLRLEIVPGIVRDCREIGINLGANFVIGFPGERWDEIRETMRFAEQQDFDLVHFHIATPLPNTDMYKKAREMGALPDDFSFTDERFFGFGNAFIETDEFTAQELLVLRAYEWDRINFATEEKTRKVAEMYHSSPERLVEHRRNTRQKCGLYFERAS